MTRQEFLNSIEESNPGQSVIAQMGIIWMAKEARRLALTHGVTWGENRGTVNPSTVPQEVIADAIFEASGQRVKSEQA